MGRFISVSFGWLVVFLSLSGTEADQDCLPGWSFYEGHCYRVFMKSMNWTDAEKFCTKQVSGGHLVSFHSSEEVDFMISLAYPLLIADLVWIGLSNFWKECKWGWSDGVKLDYKAWNEGTSCYVAKTVDNQWLRRDCSNTYKFVCKSRVPR